MTDTVIAEQLCAVRSELAQAAQRAQRPTPTLIAAVKYADEEQLEELLSLGVTDVGENRVQQLLDHYEHYRRHDTRVHFIGTLQKNKVKYIIDKVCLIHSVDSLALAQEIERQAEKKQIIMPVLVEINSAREESKSGVLPEEAEALCTAILSLPHVRLDGFMTMGAFGADESAYHRFFAETRQLSHTIWNNLSQKGHPLLSMGMSGSFTIAAGEGADMVRVGRRLFGKETLAKKTH